MEEKVDIQEARRRLKSAEGQLYEPLPNEISVSRNMMLDKNLPARTLQVTGVEKVTQKGGARITARPIYRGSEKCHRCGRDITHPTSKVVGYGPDCCEAVGIPRPARSTSAAVLLAQAHAASREAKEHTFWIPRAILDDAGIDVRAMHVATDDAKRAEREKPFAPPESTNVIGKPTFYVSISLDPDVQKIDPTKAYRCSFVRVNSPHVDTDAFPHMTFGETSRQAAESFARNLKYAGLSGHVRKAK